MGRTSRFVRRHKGKLLIGAALTAYYVYTSANSDEARRDRRVRTEEGEYLANKHRQRAVYARTVAASRTFIGSVLPSVRARLVKSDAILAKIRKVKGEEREHYDEAHEISQKDEIRKLWNELKVIAIAELVAGLYVVVYLNVLARILFAIVSRNVYIKNKYSGLDNDMDLPPIVANSFISSIMNHLVEGPGFDRLMEVVLDATTEMAGDLPLKGPFSADDLAKVLTDIRAKVDMEDPTTFLLPEAVLRAAAHPPTGQSFEECVTADHFEQAWETAANDIADDPLDVSSRNSIPDPATAYASTTAFLLRQAHRWATNSELGEAVAVSLGRAFDKVVDNACQVITENGFPLTNDERVAERCKWTVAKMIPVITGQIEFAMAPPNLDGEVSPFVEIVSDPLVDDYGLRIVMEID